jgi:hypothetical protein
MAVKEEEQGKRKGIKSRSGRSKSKNGLLEVEYTE